MVIESGCYNCKERMVGCHSKCTKYKKYREALDVINNRRKAILSYERMTRRCKCGKSY